MGNFRGSASIPELWEESTLPANTAMRAVHRQTFGAAGTSRVAGIHTKAGRIVNLLLPQVSAADSQTGNSKISLIKDRANFQSKGRVSGFSLERSSVGVRAWEAVG